MMAKTRIRQWRYIRSGWMVVDSDQLVVLRNKFLGSPEEVASFETSRLGGIEQDPASNDLKLTFYDSRGEAAEEVFSLAGGKETESVNTVIDVLLKVLEERRRQQEEEVSRLEKEKQEHRKQIREAFAGEVWETSEVLWLITRAVYSMVQAVIMANWDETRSQYSIVWQQADKLKNVHNLDLMTALTDLDETINSKNGREVIRKASNLNKQLSDQIQQTEKMWSKWQEHREILSAVSPNCNHWPYFLLFSTGYFEALLSIRTEDWTGVSQALSLLQPSGTILQACFTVDLDGLIDAANFAAGERDVNLLVDTAGRIENTLLTSIQAKDFRFNTDFDLTPRGSVPKEEISPNSLPSPVLSSFGREGQREEVASSLPSSSPLDGAE